MPALRTAASLLRARPPTASAASAGLRRAYSKAGPTPSSPPPPSASNNKATLRILVPSLLVCVSTAAWFFYKPREDKMASLGAAEERKVNGARKAAKQAVDAGKA